MLLSLDNDAVMQVLAHLTADELARFVCASHGTKSVGQRDACWASHVEGISAQYATEESQCIVDEAAPTEPEYSGPRLRMPYLTSWTTAEVEKRCKRCGIYRGKMTGGPSRQRDGPFRAGAWPMVGPSTAPTQ